MNIRQLNVQAKTAISLFLLFIILGSVSSVIYIGLSLTGAKSGIQVPQISHLKSHYSESSLVAAMKGSMNQYVVDDQDITAVENWVKTGTPKEGVDYETVAEIMALDCANCHSKSSTMSKAIPSIPLENYEQIKAHTEAGYSWSKMAKSAHIHLYGISIFMIIVTLLFAYTTYPSFIRMTLILSSFSAAFLDISSWWLSKFLPLLVYVIYVMGAVMVGSIVLMSLMILLDIWKKDRNYLR